MRTVIVGLVTVLAAVVAGAGCASEEKKDRDFFTSGSREADQRAEQRMVKEEQISGGEEEKGDSASAKADENATLYERLGGEKGVQMIVDDFVARAMADPRVNWERKGVTKGGWYRRNKPVEWKPTGDDIAKMKKHIVQFVALATGGPATYEGGDMKQAHAGLHITNAEFDASIGDLKVTLDKLGVPNDEQKELLSIVESTRPQVVTQR